MNIWKSIECFNNTRSVKHNIMSTITEIFQYIIALNNIPVSLATIIRAYSIPFH